MLLQCRCVGVCVYVCMFEAICFLENGILNDVECFMGLGEGKTDMPFLDWKRIGAKYVTLYADFFPVVAMVTHFQKIFLGHLRLSRGHI